MNLKRLLNIRPKPGASIAELREAIGADCMIQAIGFTPLACMGRQSRGLWKPGQMKPWPVKPQPWRVWRLRCCAGGC